MRKFILFLVLLTSFTFFAGCSNTADQAGAKASTTQNQVQKKSEQKLVVYRAAANGTETLLPETVTIAENGKSAMENALVALISTKPQDAKFADVVPIGTKLLGLKVDKNIAYADFSKELLKKNQGSYEEMMLAYAIVNTLTEFPEVKKVQILVEGKKAVGGHMDLEEPLTRNTTLLANGKQ